MKTTIYPVNIPQSNPPSSPPVAQQAKAALIAGTFVAAGAAALLALVAYLWPQTLAHWPLLILLDLASGMLTTSIAGFSWTRIAITRAWRVDDAERSRRWSLEDQARGPAAGTPAADELSLPERLNLAGYQILVMHYVNRQDATRPECEKVGISQADWNAVNKALQALGVKSARRWVLADHAEALRRWREDIALNPDATAMVRNPKAHAWRRVDLQASPTPERAQAQGFCRINAKP